MVWRYLGLNAGLPDQCRTLYPPGLYIYIYIYIYISWWLSFIKRHETWSRRQASMLSNIYKNLYIFTYYHYIISLSPILSTLQIISHLVCHKPTKWDCDDQQCYNIYIYIYIYIYMQISLNIIDILCLHIFFWIRSNSRITFIVFGGIWFMYCP